MVLGRIYDVSLWVSKADFSSSQNKNLIIDIAGIFTYTAPSSKLNDAVNWVNISFPYCAQGGEYSISIYSNDFSAFTSVPINTVSGCAPSSSYSITNEPYIYIDDVSVREAKFAVTSTSVACINSPTSFTINSICGVNLPNYTYNWNFGDGTASVNTGTVITASHVYAAGGNYTGTVTVNAGGCAKQYTFNASAPTLGVNLNAPVNTICNGINTFTAIPSPSGSYTYSWTVKDATTNAVITVPIYNSTSAYPSINFASVNQNVNVCVTITNAFGCKTSNCIYLPSCCATPTNAVKFMNTNFTSNFSITSANAAFGGTITVNNGVTLSITNTNVQLDPNTKFILNGTATLTLSNVYMHSCNAMWDGIYANNTSSVKMNMSRIEDAMVAINDPAGAANITLTNNYFNKNKGSVLFSAAKTNTSVVAITNNFFTSANIPVPASAPWFTIMPNLTNAPSLGTYASANMLLPYNTVKSTVGIQGSSASHTGKTADNVITIGGTTGQENVFDKIEFGIYNFQSSMQAQNNVFQNIKYSANSSVTINTGVIALVFGGSGAYYMGLGGSTTLRNTFINNDNGLYNIGQFKILNTYNTYSLQTTGVYVSYNSNSSVVNIRNNNFYQNLVGINCFNNTAINVSIKDNNLFNNTAAIGTYSSNFAIRCTEAAIATSTASYPMFNIDNNNIQNYYNGIHLAQTLNSNVFDNEVLMRQDNATNHWQWGIHVENSNAPKINNNKVDMPSLASVYWQVGIENTVNQVPRVQCNSLTNTAIGLRFVGANNTAAGDGIIGNYMNNNGYGIWLNSGDIGTQFKTGGYSADNAWNITCSGCWYIYAQSNGNPSNATMFTRSSGIYNLPNAKTGFDNTGHIMLGNNNSTGFTNICNNNASTPTNLKLGANAMAKLMQNAEDIATQYNPQFNAGLVPDAQLAQQKIREQHLLTTINLQGVV